MTFKAKISAKSAILAVCATVALTLPAAGEDRVKGLGFEAGVSTLGGYVAPKYQFSDQVSGRVPLYIGSRTFSDKVEGNTVNGKLDAASSAIMADFHPFAGAFRVSGGLGLSGYSISGTISNPVFNNNTYNATVDATVKQTNDVVPVIAVGYVRSFDNGFGVMAELGAKLGSYSLSASDANIPAPLKAQFNADVARTNEDLKKNSLTPFLTVGLSYRF